MRLFFLRPAGRDRAEAWRAVTDSDGEIRFAEENRGFNLLTICSGVLTGKDGHESLKRILRGRATAY